MGPREYPRLSYGAPLGRKKGTHAAFGCEKEDEITSDEPLPTSEIILYQTEDDRTRVQCRFENVTVWLTQAQMADLFQRERSVITKHIRNIFEEGELIEEAVCANCARTAADGKNYQALAYNLDVIISVDYPGSGRRYWMLEINLKKVEDFC